jgi:hypothetical protein
MSLFDETGIKFPSAWIYVYEVCADRGYGAKIATFEQLNTVVVEEEMRAVTSGLRAAEPHHNELSTMVNKLFDFPATVPIEEWVEALMEEVRQINSACKYED